MRSRELLAMVIDREDRFVTGAEAGKGGDDVIIRDASRAAEALVLRSIRVGIETVNFSILTELSKDVTTSFADVTETTGLDRLTLGERVNDLIQVGVATKNVETRSVAGTQAAGHLSLVEAGNF